MKGIVIDNDKRFIAGLKELCADFGFFDVVRTFDTKLEAAAFLQHTKMDFMFIDVDLPVTNSLDIFQGLNDPPATIIATNNNHFALKGYEYDFVLDYVLKPICPERYGKSFLRLANHLANRNIEPVNGFSGKLFINIDKKITKIDLKDILYVEAKGNYVTIHTEQGKFTTYASLKKVSDRLSEVLFVKIHRSFIVNIDKIVDLDQNSLVVGREVLPISRYKRTYLIEQLNHL